MLLLGTHWKKGQFDSFPQRIYIWDMWQGKQSFGGKNDKILQRKCGIAREKKGITNLKRNLGFNPY